MEVKFIQESINKIQEVIPYGYCHCGCGQKTNLIPKSLKNKGWIKGQPFKYIRYHYARLPKTHLKGTKRPQYKRRPMTEQERTNHINRMKGNKYAKGYKHTDEAKLKISLGIINNKDKIYTKERSIKLSEKLKGKNNGMYGKKLSEETRKKISIALKNKDATDPNWRKSGPEHPAWKGGLSCEPYCLDWKKGEIRSLIKERDNYKCHNPYCWGTGKILNVHHINYNKKECIPYNLITLCNSCNTRANGNRSQWEALYKFILILKYNYSY